MVRRLYAGSDEIVKRYVGSNLTHLVEWESRSRRQIVYFTTRNINDSTMTVGTSRVVTTGMNGWTDYVWTVELINGVETGNKTTETISNSLQPRQQVVAIGTAPANLLRETLQLYYPIPANRNIIRYYYPFFNTSTRINPNKNYTVTRIGNSPNLISTRLITVYKDFSSSNTNGGGFFDTSGTTKTISGSRLAGNTVPRGMHATNDIIGFSFGSHDKDITGVRIVLKEV